MLTSRLVMTIKYDFIAMKQLDFKKTYLDDLDTIVIGELVYPPSSLVPWVFLIELCKIKFSCQFSWFLTVSGSFTIYNHEIFIRFMCKIICSLVCMIKQTIINVPGVCPEIFFYEEQLQNTQMIYYYNSSVAV